MKIEYVAPAIHCEGCANSIIKSLSRLSGVQSVETDVATKRVLVEFEEAQTSDAAIRQRLTLAGFPPETD